MWPHRELICSNKWHLGTSKIFTPPGTAVGIHFHVNMALKLPRYFNLRKAFWSLLPSWLSLLSGGTVQRGNTYSCILKVTGQTLESQNSISINTNHSVYFLKLFLIDVTLTSDSVVINSIGKDGVRSWLI